MMARQSRAIKNRHNVSLSSYKEDLETKSLHIFVKVRACSPIPNLIVPLGQKSKPKK